LAQIVDCVLKSDTSGYLLFTDGLHLRIAADETCHLNIDARTHQALMTIYVIYAFTCCKIASPVRNEEN
jgi:hypothetical protein